MKNNHHVCFTIQQAAKITAFPGGEKQFFERLRTKKYLMTNNEPYQRYINCKWFELKLKKVNTTTFGFKVPVTLVTLKGIEALKRIVLREFPPCKPCINNKNFKKP